MSSTATPDANHGELLCGISGGGGFNGMLPHSERPRPTEQPGLASCLERARGGDQLAARALVAHVQPMVLRIVRAHLPRRDAAEDLAQEVFIKMFSRLGQYRASAPFAHWVSQIARRTCFDHLRAQRCRPELRRADLAENVDAWLDGTIRDEREPRQGEAFESRELIDRLLAQLGADDRMVVRRFNLEGKTMAEISRLTRWNVEFVKMRVFRARRKLRRLLARLPEWDRAAIGERKCSPVSRRAPRVRRRAGEEIPAPLAAQRAAA